MKVSEIMSTSIGCCNPESTLKDAAEQMRLCDCGAIPVVEGTDQKLVGLVTDRDIAIRGVAEGMDTRTAQVREIMSTDIATATEDADVDEIENIMETHQVRRVPIVDSQGCVCGMVSQADIALARPAEETAEVVQNVSRAYLD